MKRLNLLALCALLIMVLSACSLDDDGTNFHYTNLKIVDANLPESFNLGEVYTIDITILRPDDCTLMDEFDYQRTFTDTTQIRTFAAIGIVLDNEVCTEVNDEIQDSFQFDVQYTTPYIFKFYQGEDDHGVPQFLEIEVPVNTEP